MGAKPCPGERECTSNKFTGEIAGRHGQLQGRTLENYCHNTVATANNGLKQGCPLYDTKPENVPDVLVGAIDAAETLRRYKQRGCLPTINELTAWEYCCYDTAEEASDTVEAEEIEGETEGTSSSSTSAVGKQTSLGAFGVAKEGGAFKDW